MIDINQLRSNPGLFRASEKKRGKPVTIVDSILKVDEQWRKKLKVVEQLKQQRNIVSQEINLAKKNNNEKAAKAKIKEMQSVACQIKSEESTAENFLLERNEQLKHLGNLLHPAVPAGKDASENVELKTWGKKPKFNFPIKTHVELAEQLGLADFNAAAKASGNGFYYLKGPLGLLNQALIALAFNHMQKKGYLYVEPPLMIRKDILNAAIDAAEWDKTIYSIEGENLALIGTSEHALLGMHAGECFTEKQLPKKYFSYSMCFRKEVGAHGINEKGLWRTHQFNKVEQFIFCRPEDSEKMFTELLQNSEALLKALKLPYRVLEICSGDLSNWKQRSFDLEVWRPTTNGYGEVMSLSNCTDYQARKLGIKIVRDGKREVLHTLNNTALATSRIMVAILENYQTKKGTVKVPAALRPYLKGLAEIS